MKALDLTNNKYGLLLVLKRNKNNDKQNRPLWDCVCECGNYVTVRTRSLVSGKTKSCGCLKKNKPKKEKTKPISKRELIKQQRLGEEKYNNQGILMRIIKYNSSQDITIEFQDEFKCQKQCEYGNFIKGTIKNPYYRFLYNKGYIGEGKYTACNGKVATKEYNAWRKIFDRCYSEKYHKTEPSYIGCEICDEWHNFQCFAEWYNKHFIQIDDCIMQIDKDWKVSNNKIYSPETCEIVPSIINSCIVTHNPTKTLNLPRNIIYTTSKKYKPRLCKYGKLVELGTYETIEDAMKVYLDEKMKYIKELADKYKDYISKELYSAMVNYKERFIEENPEYATLQ